MEFKKHKLVSRFPYLATIFSLLMFLPNKVLAVDPITRLIGDAIWSFFVYPMIWALQLELAILKLVARYNNFTSEGGVILGWIALRDLSNMFFILILLVIAFATILRISSYGYQQLLKRTLIIAILINFSKSIVGFVIDIAQIVMLTFISAVDDILTGGVVVAIGLQKFTTITTDIGLDGYADYITSLVMGALLVAILLVVIGIMVMMLMMRIIALWVAIILAPLAFVASIFPATKSFYSTWVKQLGSNLVSGPMLAFFLWLTFSIVGNGEAYKTFMGSGTNAGDGATEFLGTTNLVNYIVAISLLLTGIKIAASSGAAGASFASKGMGLMQKTAGKLYRRYPKALGMRAAAGVAGRVVDKDGNLRTGFKTLGKMPFYGGRLQRGAMNVQGRNAARIAAEHAEDTKYINPSQREAFYKSQSTMPDQLKNVAGLGGALKAVEKIPGLGKASQWVGESKGLAKAAQLATSWGGGHDEAKIKKNMVKVDRDTIKDRAEAEEARIYLEKIGDQPRLDKLHSRWASTNVNKVDVEKDLKNGGARALLTNKEAESIVDEDGQATKGAKLIAKTLLADKGTDSSLINKILLSLPKRERSAWSATFEQLTKETIAKTDEQVVADKVDEKTGRKVVSFNNKGVIETDSTLERVKLAEINTAIHPQKGIGLKALVEDNLEKGIETGALNFDNNAVSHLVKGKYESYGDFEARQKTTALAWEENNKEWESINNDKTKTKEEKEAATDKLFSTRRKLMGHYTKADVDEEKTEISKDASLTEDAKKIAIQKVYQKYYNSPAFRVEDLSEKELEDAKEAGIKAELGDRPAKDSVKVAKKEVSDEEVEKLANEKYNATAQSKILDSRGREVEPSVGLMDEKRKEAREELEKKAEKERATQQKEVDKDHDKSLEKYDLEADKLRKSMTEALAGLNSADNINNKRLAEIKTEIPTADAAKLAALIAEQNTLMRLQNVLARKALKLDTPENNNLYSKGFLKNSTDGMEYSRLEEMDIKDPASRELFIELVKVATQDQQRQILNAANPEQIKLLAETIVSIGGKMNKSIIDNLSPTLKAVLNKEMAVVKEMEEGNTTLFQARAKVNRMDEKTITSNTK